MFIEVEFLEGPESVPEHVGGDAVVVGGDLGGSVVAAIVLLEVFKFLEDVCDVVGFLNLVGGQAHFSDEDFSVWPGRLVQMGGRDGGVRHVDSGWRMMVVEREVDNGGRVLTVEEV